MTIQILILINAIGYCVLGLWCALQPYETAQLVGLTLTSSQGLAEYIAVYGGLEVGLGVFYFWCLSPSRHATGLIFSLCLYGGLVLFRTGGMILFQSPTAGLGWLLYGLEIGFLAWSVLLFVTRANSKPIEGVDTGK